MNSDKPGATLFEALDGLASAGYALHRAAQHQYETRLGPLQRSVESLGLTTTAHPPRGSDEYLQDWHRYLNDPQQRLTPRALRYLCWESEVAITNPFQDYLEQDVEKLSTRMLQGLVHSCHARWSVTLVAGAIAGRVQQHLQKYQGPHRVLARWREHTTMLLGPQGHCLFATSLLAARVPIKKHCEAWALEESSQYILEAMRYAVHACQEHLGDKVLQQYFLTTLLLWAGWPVQDFHTAVGATILHPITTSDRELQGALTKLVLQDTRLGDPRLPRNIKNWLGIQDARQRLLQWLSRADIHFFFEHVLPKGTDPHGRKAFWLKYVPRVLMSRPLLNRDDALRLRASIQSLRGQMEHFGHVRGRETSAFLLDFGSVVVVEFSQVGACYLYNKSHVTKVIPDFWTPQLLSVQELKNPTLAVARIRHDREGRWQTTLAQLLAQHGIRPA